MLRLYFNIHSTVEPNRFALSRWPLCGSCEKTPYAKPDDWVFASDHSFGQQPYWPGTLWQRNVTPAIRRMGIDKSRLSWHSLRRTYDSLLLSSGASLRVTMELMRHSTAEMTLARYARTVGDEKRQAAEQVALLLTKTHNEVA